MIARVIAAVIIVLFARAVIAGDPPAPAPAPVPAVVTVPGAAGAPGGWASP
jgi:hypothetical protein